MVRLQTAPTGLGTPKLTLMVRLGNRPYRPDTPIEFFLIVL